MIRAVIKCSGLAVLFMASGALAQSDTINVKLPVKSSPEIIRAVAKYGAQEKVKIAPKEIGRVVLARCGAIDPLYLKILADANGLSADQINNDGRVREIALPACALAPAPKNIQLDAKMYVSNVTEELSVPVDYSVYEKARPTAAGFQFSAGDRPGLLRGRLRDAFGRAAAIVEDQSPDTNDLDALKRFTSLYYGEQNALQLRWDNADFDARRNQTTRTVIIPHAEPRWTSVYLKEGVSATEAVRGIQTAALTSGLPPGEVSEPGGVASLVGTVEAAQAGCSTADKSTPLVGSDVLRVMGLNQLRRDKLGLTPYEVKVLVLDTGFDFADKDTYAFPKKNMYMTTGLSSLIEMPDPQAPPETYGVNLPSNRNSPASNEGYPDRWHGTQVSGVLLGGVSFEDLRRLYPLPIRLFHANVVGKDPLDRLVIRGDALFEGIRLAASKQMDVINISLSIAQRSNALEDALRAYGSNVLAVVAAGNDRKEMGLQKIWPAAFGGAPENGMNAYVVTVGAHDNTGKFAKEFSRKGYKFLDLLAPGCDVKTYTGVQSGAAFGVHAAEATGTSMAAPAVSFVAALLRSYNLSPKEIKARLLTSVDVHDALDKVVYSRGNLNAMKALAVWSDVVSYKSKSDNAETTLMGRVTNKAALIHLCGAEYRLQTLRKIAKESDGSPMHIWISGPANHPELMDRVDLCEATADELNQSISMLDEVTQETKVLRLGELRDYIAAVK